MLDFFTNIAEGALTGQRPEMISAIVDGEPATIGIVRIPNSSDFRVRTDRGAGRITDRVVKVDESAVNAIVSEARGVRELTANLGVYTIATRFDATVSGQISVTTMRQTSPLAQAGQDAFDIMLQQFLQTDAQNLLKRIEVKGDPSLMKKLNELRDAIKSGVQGGGMSAFTLMNEYLLLLEQAGVFQGHIGDLVDARDGISEPEDVLRAIGDAIDQVPDSPVVYGIMVNKDTGVVIPEKYDKYINNKDISKNKIVLIPISAGATDPEVSAAVIDAMTSAGVTNISYMAVATNENGYGFVLNHYENADKNKTEIRFNAFIAARDKPISDKAHLAAMITVLTHLASQGQTTVITAGCGKNTIDSLKNILKSGFRWIRIAKLNIDKLVSQLLIAISSTEKSV
jgi:hypothetical protein